MGLIGWGMTTCVGIAVVFSLNRTTLCTHTRPYYYSYIHTYQAEHKHDNCRACISFSFVEPRWREWGVWRDQGGSQQPPRVPRNLFFFPPIMILFFFFFSLSFPLHGITRWGTALWPVMMCGCVMCDVCAVCGWRNETKSPDPHHTTPHTPSQTSISHIFCFFVGLVGQSWFISFFIFSPVMVK